jgi:ribosomal-protein-alanine N-acetyltransferase
MRRRVRTTEPEDLARIQEIEALCFPGPEGLSQWQLASIMAEGTNFALVAEDGGEIVGFALVQTGGGMAKLLTIDVDPARRREGNGRALMAAAEAEARRRGCERLFLEVRSTNDAARAMYSTVGYREVRVIKGYYFFERGGSADAVEMEKMLV